MSSCFRGEPATAAQSTLFRISAGVLYSAQRFRGRRLLNPAPRCRRDAAVQTVWTPEMLWQVFESTGSIWAYLVYRRFAAFRKASLKVSLN